MADSPEQNSKTPNPLDVRYNGAKYKIYDHIHLSVKAMDVIIYFLFAALVIALIVGIILK